MNIKNEFIKDLTLLRANNESFSQKMCRIIDTQKAQDYDADGKVTWKPLSNKVVFENVTQLSTSIYDRIKAYDGNNEYVPSLETVITLCMVYNLDIQMAETLLMTLGVTFKKTDKKHNAYSLLLTKHRGKNIYECNEILEQLGVERKDWLGRKKKNEM